MGLSVCQKLVRALNYNRPDLNLEVESMRGVGSKFSFPLAARTEFLANVSERVISSRRSPLVFTAQSNKIYNMQEENTSPRTDHSSTINNFAFKILIVDDDQINLLIAKSY